MGTPTHIEQGTYPFSGSAAAIRNFPPSPGTTTPLPELGCVRGPAAERQVEGKAAGRHSPTQDVGSMGVAGPGVGTSGDPAQEVDMSKKRTLEGRRIAVLAADGFEKVELTVPVRAL